MLRCRHSYHLAVIDPTSLFIRFFAYIFVFAALPVKIVSYVADTQHGYLQMPPLRLLLEGSRFLAAIMLKTLCI